MSADDPRDAATWGLINARDGYDRADWPDDTQAFDQYVGALDPWIQQLTEIMTTIAQPADGHGATDPLPFEARRAMQKAIWEECIAPGGNEWTTWTDAIALTETAAAALTANGWAVVPVLLPGEPPPKRALVGIAGSATHGRPATPTRDEVWAAVNERFWAHELVSRAWSQGSGPEPDTVAEAFVSEVTDAVVALLSRPAAEPPEIDVLRGLLDHAVQSWSPRGTGRAPILAEWDDTDWADSGWTEAERVELRAAVERVEAEPNEEHGDG